MQGYYAQSVKKWSNFNLRKLPFSSIWSPLVGLSRFFMKLMARLDGVLFQAQTNPTTKLMAGLGSGSFKHGLHKQIQRHQIVMKRIYGQAHQPWLIDSIGLIQTLLHKKIIFMGNLNWIIRQEARILRSRRKWRHLCVLAEELREICPTWLGTVALWCEGRIVKL